nr:phosphatidylinositol-glycan biosynthesis class F protein isoform X2 [Setaria viridis]
MRQEYPTLESWLCHCHTAASPSARLPATSRAYPAMRAEATQISAFTTAAAHALCFAGLAVAHSLAGRGVLVSDPALALRLLVVCEAPVVIAVFSYLRRDPRSCSFFKAAARGLIGLPVGAFLNAFGAIVLGAPVGIKYWTVTIYWSLLMSLFTFVPAACVFGTSKIDWQNVLSHSIYFTPTDIENYMISAPCHGAVLGAWLGAWPMPLDWERPWQEWPICVTYGAVAGHLVGMVVSWVLIAVHKRSGRAKAD